MRVHIQQFAGKIQVGQDPAAHGGGIHFPDVHAAPGHDGLLQGPGPADPQGKGFEGGGQGVALLRGDLIAAKRSGQAAQAGKELRQAGGKQGAQLRLQQLFPGSSKIPQQAGIQLFRGKAGLQIDPEQGRRGILRQVAACLQHQRAGNAEMGEKHLPQLGIKLLFAGGKGQHHIAQA